MSTARSLMRWRGVVQTLVCSIAIMARGRKGADAPVWWAPRDICRLELFEMDCLARGSGGGWCFGLPPPRRTGSLTRSVLLSHAKAVIRGSQTCKTSLAGQPGSLRPLYLRPSSVLTDVPTFFRHAQKDTQVAYRRETLLQEEGTVSARLSSEFCDVTWSFDSCCWCESLSALPSSLLPLGT